MQEAVQQGSFASAAAAGGHSAGASGGSADRIQVFETGQVLREETYDVVIVIGKLRSHDHSSASGEHIKLCEVFLLGPGCYRGLCSIHSNPVCCADAWMDPAEAPSTS